MGSWKDQWERVSLALSRVDAVYAGRPEPEGTAGATYPSGNDATVMIGSGAKHAFRVESAGVERDAQALARSCVAEWTSFLAARNLI